MKTVVLAFAFSFSTLSLSAADFFPQVALGGGYECVLFVTNRTSGAWAGWAKLLAGNNQSWPGSWSLDGTPMSGNVINFELAPKATRKFLLAGDQTVRAGYLQVFGGPGHSSGDVSPVLFYNFKAGQQLMDSTGVPASGQFNSFMFPVEKTASIDTGFAWALRNTSGSFPVTLTLFNRDGVQAGPPETRTFSGHQAQFFSELFPGVPNGFVGMVRIEAETRFSLVVIRLEYTAGGFQLTAIPPETNVP